MILKECVGCRENQKCQFTLADKDRLGQIIEKQGGLSYADLKRCHPCKNGQDFIEEANKIYERELFLRAMRNQMKQLRKIVGEQYIRAGNTLGDFFQGKVSLTADNKKLYEKITKGFAKSQLRLKEIYFYDNPEKGKQIYLYLKKKKGREISTRQAAVLLSSMTMEKMKPLPDQKKMIGNYYEIYGFGYKSALKLADGFQVDKNDNRRLDAYIYETARQLAMISGNTYITLVSLIERCKGATNEDIQASLERLSVQKSIHIEEGKVYPFSLYDDEISIASHLFEHIFEVESVDEMELEQKIKEVEFSYAIEYDEEQKKAIRLFFEKSFFILNGGPGTGKTTTVKGILNICRSFFPDATIQLCAPTGRASKRLAQLSSCDSRTIHSLLQWNKDDNTFAKNEEDPLEIDFLIVDEFSMVDTHLFAQLLKALPRYCRILLIGDEDQLESVGPGKVFEDLIASHICPIIHLEKIFRQSEGSGIITLASQIRKEERCFYEDGVTFIERDAKDIMECLDEIVRNKDMDNLQILAPMYKGVAGIDAINVYMQALYNPQSNSKSQFRVGTTVFREGDKVMLLKNLPDDDVYNGDIGSIVSIDTVDRVNHVISVDFGNTIVDFSSDFLYYLNHAYCISVHKAQGSEYESVICIVEPNARYMLEKRLLYTAVSRAKKELILIGNQPLFEKQVKLKQKRIRQTTLVQRIKSYQGGLENASKRS